MPRPIYRQRWAWAAAVGPARQEKILGIEGADLSLSALADHGLLTTRQLADWQDATGLADLFWRMCWNRAALDQADGDMRSLLRRTQGFVIFMHGWGSSGLVWEPLPALVCAANPRLVALVPDLNGFGGSPFLADVPALEQCSPPAVMQAVAHWVDLLGLRSGSRAQQRRRVLTFIGHSVGGAALFFFDACGWQDDEYARCAIAPTLLLAPEIRQDFYRDLGAEGWSGKSIDERKARLTAKTVERFAADRTDHGRVFETTPKATLVQTLVAIGALPAAPQVKQRQNFRVVLGHDDPLLNVSTMLKLLDDLGLASHQVQVVRGTHHLLSVGDQGRQVYLRNRELVVGEILYLHEACRERQRAR
jgi:pimeloyl-ACP methyl ester carboxylesterase